jgi:hypothetical protein
LALFQSLLSRSNTAFCDSIRAGVDSYTWGSARDLVSSLTDYGDSSTPYLILAYSFNQTSLAHIGTETLIPWATFIQPSPTPTSTRFTDTESRGTQTPTG